MAVHLILSILLYTIVSPAGAEGGVDIRYRPDIQAVMNESWLVSAEAMAAAQGTPWPSVADLLTADPLRFDLPPSAPAGRTVTMPSGLVLRWAPSDDSSMKQLYYIGHGAARDTVSEPKTILLFGAALMGLVVVLPLLRRVASTRAARKAGTGEAA